MQDLINIHKEQSSKRNFVEVLQLKHNENTPKLKTGGVFLCFNLAEQYWKSESNRKMLFLFLVIKSRKRFLNFTYKDLQNASGFSYFLVKKYLDILIKSGLVSRKNDVLEPIAWKKFTKKGFGERILIKNDYKQFRIDVQNMLFKNNIKKQSYMISLRDFNSNTHNITSTRVAKRKKSLAKKYLGPMPYGGKSSKHVRAGYKKISRLTGVNVSKVKEFLASAVENQIIQGFYSKDYKPTLRKPQASTYTSTTIFVLNGEVDHKPSTIEIQEVKPNLKEPEFNSIMDFINITSEDFKLNHYFTDLDIMQYLDCNFSHIKPLLRLSYSKYLRELKTN